MRNAQTKERGNADENNSHLRAVMGLQNETSTPVFRTHSTPTYSLNVSSFTGMTLPIISNIECINQKIFGVSQSGKN